MAAFCNTFISGQLLANILKVWYICQSYWHRFTVTFLWTNCI